MCGTPQQNPIPYEIPVRAGGVGNQLPNVVTTQNMTKTKNATETPKERTDSLQRIVFTATLDFTWAPLLENFSVLPFQCSHQAVDHSVYSH